MISPPIIVNQISVISNISNIAITILFISKIDFVSVFTAEIIIFNETIIHDSGKKTVDVFAELIKKVLIYEKITDLPRCSKKIKWNYDWKQIEKTKFLKKLKYVHLVLKIKKLSIKVLDELQILNKLFYTIDSVFQLFFFCGLKTRPRWNEKNV